MLRAARRAPGSPPKMGVSGQRRAPQWGQAGLDSAKSPADLEGNKGARRALGMPVWQCQPCCQGGGRCRGAACFLRCPAARYPDTVLTLMALWPRELLTRRLRRPGPAAGARGCQPICRRCGRGQSRRGRGRRRFGAFPAASLAGKGAGGEAGSAPVPRTPAAASCCATAPGRTTPKRFPREFAGMRSKGTGGWAGSHNVRQREVGETPRQPRRAPRPGASHCHRGAPGQPGLEPCTSAERWAGGRHGLWERTWGAGEGE